MWKTELKAMFAEVVVPEAVERVTEQQQLARRVVKVAVKRKQRLELSGRSTAPNSKLKHDTRAVTGAG